ncbi:MAG: hypothetical protein QOH88_1566 [Verrucomicrobiota bacterium]
MRIAALYDIHGNLPALEAVLKDLHRAEVDHIVVGGDVLPGPMPRETLQCLLELHLPTSFIRGNGDRVVLEQMAGKESREVPESFRDVIRWNAEQLAPEHERLIAGWPETVRLQIGGQGEVLFCHATPRNDIDVFSRLTPEGALIPIFEEPDVPTVICGHTHMQFDRTIGNVRVVNAGSVGMPFGEPGAYWLLLGTGVQLRHTNYNVSEAAARIRATSYPQAHEFAARNVLQPPSEAAMLEAFAKAD